MTAVNTTNSIPEVTVNIDSEFNELKYIFIDEYTENITSISDILIGSAYAVSFDYYFDGYLPITVYANSVIVNIE